MHVLEVPIAADEFRSHPVQQFGITRQRSLGAEVVLGFHDSQTEIALPDAIHGHARGQRILRRDEPPRQSQPVARGVLRERRQHGQGPGFDVLAPSREIALHVEVGIARLGKIPHHQRPLDPRDLLLQLLDLILEFLVFLLVLVQDASQHVLVQVRALSLRDCRDLSRPFEVLDVSGRVTLVPRGFQLAAQLDEFALFAVDAGAQAVTPLQGLRLAEFEDRLHHATAPHRLAQIAAQFVDIVEERIHLEELALRNGIELVIVAAGASQGESEERRPCRADAIDDRVDAVLLEIDSALLIDHRVAMEAGRDQLVVGRVRQEVAGDLLDHEAIERHVVVQGIDHPVAVAPDRAIPVDGVAVRVGVAGDVKPMPAPALAVVRGLQQPLDQATVRAGFFVVDERTDFRRAREQPGQVQAHPADQSPPVRFGGRLQAFGFELGEHECVNGIAVPALSVHARRLGPLHGAQRPQGNRGFGIAGRAAPSRPGANPCSERLDFRGREGSRRRHSQGPGVFDRLDQEALVRAARRDRRPATPAAQGRLPRGERQAAGLECLAVAALAAGREYGPNPFLEEPDAI